MKDTTFLKITRRSQASEILVEIPTESLVEIIATLVVIDDVLCIQIVP